jgi:hypothetical protein
MLSLGEAAVRIEMQALYSAESLCRQKPPGIRHMEIKGVPQSGKTTVTHPSPFPDTNVRGGPVKQQKRQDTRRHPLAIFHGL